MKNKIIVSFIILLLAFNVAAQDNGKGKKAKTEVKETTAVIEEQTLNMCSIPTFLPVQSSMSKMLQAGL